jgi:predicted nucleotide-binding protein
MVPPAATLRPQSLGVPTPAVEPRRVFVVHGRDTKIRGALFGLLYAVGLKPEAIPRASRHSPSGTPFTLDAIEAAMRAARAIVVLMAPEEVTALASELAGDDDERGLQPRPNVFVELGMARPINPEGTIVVETGPIRRPSDLDGLNIVRIDDSYERRNELLRRLEDAGCPVDWRTEWAYPSVTGSFEPSVRGCRRRWRLK